MSRRQAPAWLADFQASFGDVLRTPLDRSTGTLRATPERYALGICHEALSGPSLAGNERLAVYNRQYWFRLLTLMQQAFPLSTQLLGSWLWNGLAARFLLACPPSTFDLHDVTHGFERFVARSVAGPEIERGPHCAVLPSRALLEAVRIDAAYRRVFFAPDEPAWQITEEQGRRLATQRLVAARRWELVEESWPLLQLRDELRGRDDETPVALPPALAGPRAWSLLRTETGVARIPAEPQQAALLAGLRVHDVGSALAMLERDSDPQDRAALLQRTQQWLAQSAALGFFCGTADS